MNSVAATVQNLVILIYISLHNWNKTARHPLDQLHILNRTYQTYSNACLLLHVIFTVQKIKIYFVKKNLSKLFFWISNIFILIWNTFCDLKYLFLHFKYIFLDSKYFYRFEILFSAFQIYFSWFEIFLSIWNIFSWFDIIFSIGPCRPPYIYYQLKIILFCPLPMQKTLSVSISPIAISN